MAPYLELATLYTASCKVELHRPKSGYSDRTPHIYMRCPEGGGGGGREEVVVLGSHTHTHTHTRRSSRQLRGLNSQVLHPLRSHNTLDDVIIGPRKEAHRALIAHPDLFPALLELPIAPQLCHICSVRKCCGAVSARRGLRAPRVGLEAGEHPPGRSPMCQVLRRRFGSQQKNWASGVIMPLFTHEAEEVPGMPHPGAPR